MTRGGRCEVRMLQEDLQHDMGGRCGGRGANLEVYATREVLCPINDK